MNDTTQTIKPGVIICSGGLDSTTLLYYLHNKGADIKAISFDYGQRHDIELTYAQYHTKQLQVPHTIINLKDIFKHVSFASALLGGMDVPTLEEVIGDPQPITYVPFRNMLMLTIAAAVAENTEGEAVYYGAQKHDEYSGYWDTTSSFTDQLQQVFNLNRKHKITVEAPFVDLSKSDLVKIGMELGVDYAKTMTCYNGNNCGTCPTCRDRLAAFKRAGYTDPATYLGA